MTQSCCMRETAPRRPSLRLSFPASIGTAASILHVAVLALLPKCPLCLAAWLTVVTGVGFSAAGAAWVRGMLVVFSIAAVALGATVIIRRQAVRGRLPGT